MNTKINYNRDLSLIGERFLISIGTTFRNELPRSIIKKTKLRQNIQMLVIDWIGNDDHVMAHWKIPTEFTHSVDAISTLFSLKESILSCIECFSGADDELIDIIADLFIDDLRNGIAAIPRLSPISHTNLQSVFQWLPIQPFDSLTL